MAELVMLAGVLLVPLLVFLPLWIYCARQEARGRLFSRGVIGLVVGGIASWILLALLVGDTSGADPGVVVFLLLILGVGGFVGAHVGVGLTECLDDDPLRSAGARRGALYGLGVGLLIGVALVLIAAAEDEVLWMILAAAIPMGGAVGALFGAQSGAAGRLREEERAPARRLPVIAWVLILVVLGVPAYYRWQYEVQTTPAGDIPPPPAYYPGIESINAALQQLKGGNQATRLQAVATLQSSMYSWPDPRIEPALIKATRDRDRNVRLAAIAALGSSRSSAAIEPLGKLLNDRDAGICYAALQALLGIPDYAISPYIRKAAEDDDPKVSGLARRMMQSMPTAAQ